MRIGILGSACDPPHRGHIALCESARKALKLDRLMLIPTKIPPHKAKPGISPKMRLAMARLAVRGRPGWVVSDMELRRVGKSYTPDTIQELRRLYPGDELFWIIGSDSFVAMPEQWEGGYDVLDLCRFVVLPRKGYPLRKAPKSARRKVIILKRTRYWDVSSTKIRALLKKGEKITARLVAKPVQEFIKHHHLYT